MIAETDGEAVRYEPCQPMTLPETEAELAERMASDEMIAVELKENGKLIGNVYLGRGNPSGRIPSFTDY